MRRLPLALLLTLLVGLAAPGSAAEHPRLVSVSASRCGGCHGDLLKDRPDVHSPVRVGCAGCHQVSISEAGTRISLVAPQPALCLECHAALAAAASGELASSHAPVTASCLTCHDPHAGAGEDLLVAPAVELCAGCHEPAGLAAPHGGLLTAATDCGRCHDAHGSPQPGMLVAGYLHAPFAEGSCDACHKPPFGGRPRLARRGEKLCLACHGDLLLPAGEAVSIHAALAGERGRAGCLGCHDPHLSDDPKLLAAAGLELCRQCHGEVVAAARAPTGHPPAAETCLSCHRPHDSVEAKLLSLPPKMVCATCHGPADAPAKAAHLGAEPAPSACTTCHSPHGAGQPWLLAKSVHEPVLEGCDTCHEGSFDRFVKGGDPSLCLSCHGEVGRTSAAAEVAHGALVMAPCSVCHNPHASAQEHLVGRPAGGACLDCHDDVGPGAGESMHGIIELVGCRACHEPHGGRRRGLLREAGAALCLSCHDPGVPGTGAGTTAVRLLDRFEIPADRLRALGTLRLSADGLRHHPVVNHRVLGAFSPEELRRTTTTFEGEELTCLSCHDPHKGRFRLLRWGARSALEACLACHPK